MKKVICLFIGLMGGGVLLAQSDSMPYPISEEMDFMPYFAGCDDFELTSPEKRSCSNENLIAFIANNLRYPERAKEEGVEGTVFVLFTINENGNIQDPSILREIGGGCGIEAINVVKQMPPWIPAQKEGKNVAVQLRLPIKFNLSEGEVKQLASKYKISWGTIRGQKIQLDAIQSNIKKDIIIRDINGNALHISELVFSYEKNNRFISAKSRGSITKDLERIAKKCREGGLFTISATIIDGTKFIDVDHTFEVVK